MTWSIIARDPVTGQFGIAVATKFFAVGARVPHIAANVGGIATQALVNPYYGIDGVKLLREGRSPREVVDTLLAAAGMENYEISNWALPGHECRHNLLYWRQQNYRGFGCAAHSHEDGRRWWNVRTPDRYIELVAAGESVEAAGETLDAPTREFERLELMLRMRNGVPLDALDGEQLPGLVERLDDRWVLTRRGRLMANAVSLHLK